MESLELRTLCAGDVVLDWNETLLDAVRADRTAPPLAARNMAMVHVAVYDAVNAVVRGHEGYLLDHSVPKWASVDAAAATAAHDVLMNVFPAQTAAFDGKLGEWLAAVPDGKAESAGVALGARTAALVLDERADDGASDTVPYTGGDQPGDWRPTPPAFQQDPVLPQWGAVTPFALKSGSQFRPDGPPALDSAEYAAAFNEVKSLGSATSTTRTADQTTVARFWADGAGTATPPGHWNEIAQDLALAEGNTVADNARMFALLNMAVADAGVACWDAKYTFDFWRPVTAIRLADTDGNPLTEADPNWTPLLATPPFPSYTSGHSTFSAAAATTLAHFFGTDDLAFTTTDDDTPGVVRSFASLSAAAAEAGMSRIYGGIHSQFDNTDATECGVLIGNWVADHELESTRPVKDRGDKPVPPGHAQQGGVRSELAVRDRPVREDLATILNPGPAIL